MLSGALPQDDKVTLTKKTSYLLCDKSDLAGSLHVTLCGMSLMKSKLQSVSDSMISV